MFGVPQASPCPDQNPAMGPVLKTVSPLKLWWMNIFPVTLLLNAPTKKDLVITCVGTSAQTTGPIVNVEKHLSPITTHTIIAASLLENIVLWET